MQPLDRRKNGLDVDEYDTSSDEEGGVRGVVRGGETSNWNDVPEGFLDPGRRGRGNGSVRGRGGGRKKGD
jgi:hypothetical protein